MRVRSLLAAVALLATSVFAIEIVSQGSQEEVVPPKELVVSAGFPDSNPFGHVVNGEKNQLILKIENYSGKSVTLLSVAGEFHNPDTDKLIKATNNNTYGVPLIDGAKIQLPYMFHSEYKPGDVKLNVFLETVDEDGEKQRVQAFESIVTVVEPALSIFDFKLLSTYATVLGLISALGYFAYVSLVPQPKKAVKKPAVSAPVGTVTATGAGGYQEEWIPEHHLRKGKGKKTAGFASSADELSGAETSGAEGKRRKGRK